MTVLAHAAKRVVEGGFAVLDTGSDRLKKGRHPRTRKGNAETLQLVEEGQHRVGPTSRGCRETLEEAPEAIEEGQLAM